MGVKVEKSINTGVTKDALREKVGKLDNFDSIFDRFDTNNDGTLDEGEQVGMMAYLNKLAGDDGKIKKNEVDSNELKDDFGGAEITYKDMKKFVNAYNKVIKKNKDTKQEVTTEGDGTDTKYNTRDNQYTLDGHQRVNTQTQKRTGNVTTNEYDEQNNISQSVTEQQDKTKTTTNYSYSDGGHGTQIKKRDETVSGDGNVTTTNTYNGTHRIEVIQDKRTPNVTTTNNYNNDRLQSSKEVKTDDASTKTSTTYYLSDGKTPSSRNSVTTYNRGDIKSVETNYMFNGDNPVKNNELTTYRDDTPQNPHRKSVLYSMGNLSQQVVTNGKVTTTTKYNGTNGAVETINDGNNNTTTVTNYSVYAADGTVSPSNATKKVFTDKNKHLRTTTYPTGNNTHITEYEQLDNANSQVVMSTKIDTKDKKVTYTAGNQTVQMATSADGKYVMANAKWDASKNRMETYKEVASRLGYSGSDLDKILKANGGKANSPVPAGGAIKIPVELTLGKSISTLKAASDVDAAAQKQAYNTYQARQREIADLEAQLDELTRKERCGDNGEKYCESADKVIANWDKKGTTRATFASDNYRVFCDQKYTETPKKYQQHYIYSAYENKMVTIESVCKNIPEGEKVKWMNSNGYAQLTNGNYIQLDLDDNKIHGKKYIGTYEANSEKAKAIRARIGALKNYKNPTEIEKTSTEDYLKMVEDGRKFETDATDDDGTRTQHLQNTGTQYDTDELKAKAHNRFERKKQENLFKDLEETSNPFIFRNGRNYYVYYLESDGLGVESIDSIGSDGSVTSKGKTYTSDEYLLSIRLRQAADTYRSDVSTSYMHEAIVNNINKDNVVGVLNAFKELGSEKGIIGRFTEENCTYGAGGGRDKAVQSAKHIVQALLDKATAENIPGDFKIIKYAKDFIDGKFLNFDFNKYINDSYYYDVSLYSKVKDIMDELVKTIQTKQDTQITYSY